MIDHIHLTRTFGDEHKGRAGHINIQHYAQLIEDARHAWLQQQGLPLGALILSAEKVRFSSELHSGDTATARMDFFTVDESINTAVEITRAHDNAVVTRCNQSFAARQPIEGLPDHGEDYGLRSINADGTPGNHFTSFGDVVPAELNRDGTTVNARGLWYVMTEALWAVQNQIGASRDYLSAEGIAGGASMFELQHHRVLNRDATLRVVTTPIGRSDSSLRYQHDIYDDETNAVQPAITARYVLTYFDRATGSRIAVPDMIIAQLW